MVLWLSFLFGEWPKIPEKALRAFQLLGGYCKVIVSHLGISPPPKSRFCQDTYFPFFFIFQLLNPFYFLQI